MGSQTSNNRHLAFDDFDGSSPSGFGPPPPPSLDQHLSPEDYIDTQILSEEWRLNKHRHTILPTYPTATPTTVAAIGGGENDEKQFTSNSRCQCGVNNVASAEKPAPTVFKAVAAQEAAEFDKDELIPCVFTWTHGGHNVYLTGSFNNWSFANKVRLNRSGHDFSYIKNLPRGLHLYKFIVDEQWKYAPDQQTQSDEHGNINNVLDISSYTHFNFALHPANEQAREEKFHQSVPEPSEYSLDAPAIPILLSKSTQSNVDPPPRPGGGIPIHCLANHLYHDAYASSIFGPHTSCLATTQRWQVGNERPTSGQRYTTYIYVTVNPLYPFPGSSENATSLKEGDSTVTPADVAAATTSAHTSPIAGMLMYTGLAMGEEEEDGVSRSTLVEESHQSYQPVV